MARIVLGLASSHSPMLCVPPHEWVASYGAKDQYDPSLPNYSELVQEHGARLAAEITPEKCQQRYARVQGAMDQIAQTLARVKPDVIVAIGDDHHEMFAEDHMPAVNIFWGEKYLNAPAELEKIPAFRRAGMWAYHPQTAQSVPCDGALGRHLIQALIARQFDVSHSHAVAAEREIGHAFNFIARRFMASIAPIPLVPIFLNTYFPPTQPTVARCYALGQALRQAIESDPSNKTVAVVASGGLSHFIVDEKIDRAILTAMEEKNRAALCRWPETIFQSGTSEVKTWIALAGAMEQTPLKMHLIDYVTCYRSLAGTGVGAGFAEWR